jgi:SAM-dependent methyltransferase
VNELTEAEAWDEVWAQAPAPGAATWARARTRSARSWQRLLARLLAGAVAGDDVLELGCAPGTMLVDLHRHRPDLGYRGVDYAPSGLRRCRATLEQAGITATLHLGDITADLPLAPAALVMSFGLVEHFDDPVAAIGHHRRRCRPQGTVAVTVPNYSHPLVVGLLRRYSPQTLATHHLDIMSVDRLAAAMVAAGLTDVAAGSGGGPLLPNGRARASVGGRIYRQAARVWNVGSAVLPATWPWPAVIWATGRNPSPTGPHESIHLPS